MTFSCRFLCLPDTQRSLPAYLGGSPLSAQRGVGGSRVGAAGGWRERTGREREGRDRHWWEKGKGRQGKGWEGKGQGGRQSWLCGCARGGPLPPDARVGIQPLGHPCTGGGPGAATVVRRSVALSRHADEICREPQAAHALRAAVGGAAAHLDRLACRYAAG